MEAKQQNPTVYTYLDRIMGTEGIKTSNKIEINIDRETAITLVGIGVGLVVFSHLLGLGVKAISKRS